MSDQGGKAAPKARSGWASIVGSAGNSGSDGQSTTVIVQSSSTTSGPGEQPSTDTDTKNEQEQKLEVRDDTERELLSKWEEDRWSGFLYGAQCAFRMFNIMDFIFGKGAGGKGGGSYRKYKQLVDGAIASFEDINPKNVSEYIEPQEVQEYLEQYFDVAFHCQMQDGSCEYMANLLTTLYSDCMRRQDFAGLLTLHRRLVGRVKAHSQGKTAGTLVPIHGRPPLSRTYQDESETSGVDSEDGGSGEDVDDDREGKSSQKDQGTDSDGWKAVSRRSGSKSTGNRVSGSKSTGNRVSGSKSTGNRVSGSKSTGNRVDEQEDGWTAVSSGRKKHQSTDDDGWTEVRRR